MANKSITMTKVRRIIELKSEGLSKLSISQSVHIHINALQKFSSKELTP
jgi:hypothetical protein